MFEIQSNQIVDEIEHRKFQDASDALYQDVWLMRPFTDRNGQFHSVPDQADSLVDEINKHINYDSHHDHASYDTILWGDCWAEGSGQIPWKDSNVQGEFYFATSEGDADSNCRCLDVNPATQPTIQDEVSPSPLNLPENDDQNGLSQTCVASIGFAEIIGTYLGARYGRLFGAAIGANSRLTFQMRCVK